jgi:hypothetical protein
LAQIPVLTPDTPAPVATPTPSVRFRPAAISGSLGTTINITPNAASENGLSISSDGKIGPFKAWDVVLVTFGLATWSGLADMKYNILDYNNSDSETQAMSAAVGANGYSISPKTFMLLKNQDGYIKLTLSPAASTTDFTPSNSTNGIWHVARLTGGAVATTMSTPLMLDSSAGISAARANDIKANDYIDIKMTFVQWEPITIEIIGVTKLEAYGRWNSTDSSLGITATTGMEVTPLGGGSIRIRNVSSSTWYGNLVKVTYMPSAVALTRNTPA